MGINSSSTNLFDSLHQWCRAEHGALSSNKLYERPYRMEASFYTSDGYASLNAMRNSGFNLHKIGEIATVFWFGPFARRYVSDPVYGIPFLSSSNMMEARPKSYNLISKKNTKILEKYVVKEGDILISRSGTIGNIALVTKDMGGWTVSEHAIRVIVQDVINLGIAYCFLQSSLGQFLIQRSMSGSVVQSIYEADVSSLPIPRLPLRLREELTKRIQEVSDLRVEANRLLDQAEELIYKKNNIERPSKEFEIKPDIFTSNCNSINERYNEERYHRLDSKFYGPAELEIRNKIKNCKYWKYLGDVSRIILIGKTFVPGVNKVEKEYGIPYFTGKELFGSRIVPDTYIASKKKTDIDKLIVPKGVTLITCAGTSGKVAYVDGQLEGCSVTHDAMRVFPLTGIHGGYLYAFLACDLGQMQLHRCSYGSVHSRLHDSQIGKIVIPIPEDCGEEIGKIVNNGFDLITKARKVEDSAIDLFISAIREGRKATEVQWGGEE